MITIKEQPMQLLTGLQVQTKGCVCAYAIGKFAHSQFTLSLKQKQTMFESFHNYQTNYHRVSIITEDHPLSQREEHTFINHNINKVQIRTKSEPKELRKYT